MPELPEVECAVRYLEKRLKGQSIKNALVKWDRIVATPQVNLFIEKIRGAKFSEFSRRGKYIIIRLKDRNKEDLYLIAHLRMSGSFDVVGKNSLSSKHDHVIFELQNNKELRFHDIRKFGKIYLVKDKDEIISKLGYEPLESSLTADIVHLLFSKFKSPVKTMLLRQDILAGVGNIYADECLWAASIHPQTPVNRIKKEKVALLLKELRKILKLAIKTNGTDNGDNVVYGGMYSPKAYGRAGEKCMRCEKLLKRIIVAQRGTSFCPGCQKK